MRTVVTLFLVLVVALSAADGYRDDARLAKPITLRLKIVPLSDCVKALSRESGVPISVTANVWDRKLTVICREKPAAEVMKVIAKTIFCEWRSEGDGGYRLEIPRDVLKEESDMVEAEAQLALQRMTNGLRDMNEIAKLSSDEAAAKYVAAKKKVEALTQQLNPTSADYAAKAEELEAAKAELDKFQWRGWMGIAEALGGASDAGSELAAGRTLFASTEPIFRLTLSKAALPHFNGHFVSGADSAEPHPISGVLAVRFNAQRGFLESRIWTTGDEQTSYGVASQPIGVASTSRKVLESQPLAKRMERWARTFDSEIYQRRVREPGSVRPTSEYVPAAYTMADQLEQLSDAADLPIVADGFRVEASPAIFLGGDTVDEVVKHLREDTSVSTRNGFFRSELGWLMFRHPRFWSLQSLEISERQFASIEAVTLQRRAVGLSDYASFASSLTAAQATSFAMNPPVMRCSRTPLVRAMAPLRLWASLSSGQRQQAYESVLPLASLNAPQRELFGLVTADLVWSSQRGDVGNFIMSTRDPNRAGFFIRDWRNIGGASANRSQPAPEVMAAQKQTVLLGFGTQDAGMTYHIQLPGGN